MSIQVALIDKSEIVHKMVSHCLHYFSVEVSRFEQLEECLNHFVDKKPDIVFVDWENKKGEEQIIYLARDKMESCPVVLLYRSSHQDQIDSLSKEQIPYRIKKPINPKELREIFTQLVPQIKESKIHSYLRFPKSEEKGEQEMSSQTKEIKKLTVAKTPNSETHTGYIDKTKSFVGNLIKKTGLTELTKKSAGTNITEKKDPAIRPTGETNKPHLTTQTHLTDKMAKTHLTTQTHLTDKTAKTHLTTQIPLTHKTNKTTGAKLTEGLEQKNQFKEQNSNLLQEKTRTKKVNKEDISIDENTKNDLAPMAMKSSAIVKGQSKISINRELSEKDVLKVISKYKDSLEFQELMENILINYAKKTVTNILQGDKVKDILQQPLKEFKDSHKFKELVEKESSKYIQKQLPLIMKQIVEQEIKKIIGN